MVLFTSCDAYGRQAEYVRYGLEFDRLIKNIDKILLLLPKVTVVIMSTFNIFSIFTYEQLVKKVYELKVKHFNPDRFWNSALILDTSYLRFPSFLSVNILEREHKELILDAAKKALYYGKFENGYGFSDIQIQKIKLNIRILH